MDNFFGQEISSMEHYQYKYLKNIIKVLSYLILKKFLIKYIMLDKL